MNIPLLVVCAYIGVIFLISWYTKRRASGKSENYILAGRKLTWPLIMVTIVGLAVGGASTIGVAEKAFTAGISAGWYTTAWGIGAIVMGLTVAKKYRSLNITTIPEMLERYYDKKSMGMGTFCQILVQLVIMSMQYVAAGMILTALLPEVFTPVTGMLFSAIVFIGITLIGGMWSASVSNLMNDALTYAGIIIAVLFSIRMAGGMENITLNLPMANGLDFVGGIGPMTIITWIVVLITVNLSLQSIIQISLGAKDVHTARKGFIIGGIVMLPVGFICGLLGVIAAELYPNISVNCKLNLNTHNQETHSIA